MAAAGVAVGDQISPLNQLLLKNEAVAQSSCEDMNLANKQDQESKLDQEEVIRHEISYTDEEFTIKDEAHKLLKEMKIVIRVIKESKFYTRLTEEIKSATFQSQLKQVLGSYSELNMVIYALGSLEFLFNSQYQLAIALLLKHEFSSWIGGIEVYDPCFSPADVVAMKELGCEVLSVNERCRRKIEKPTLFYMPFAFHSHVGDLLGANWCPSRINQLILLTTSFKLCNRGRNPKPMFLGRPEDYIDAIQNHTKEILIEGGYGCIYDNIFYDFAFHFFEVDSQLDMDNLIPDDDGKLLVERLNRQRESDMKEPTTFLWLQKRSEKFFMKTFAEVAPEQDWNHIHGNYRGPRKYRCSWNPPPRGWIKLNIGGRSSENGDNITGFGGICYNDQSKEPILVYNGAISKEDETAACIEALKLGLIELLKMPTRNLIVEGDNLWVIQLANRVLEPPEEILESLNEVRGLLEQFNSVVYHIYEEANSVASNLAKKGAVSGNDQVYLLGQDSEDLGDVHNLLKCLVLQD